MRGCFVSGGRGEVKESTQRSRERARRSTRGDGCMAGGVIELKGWADGEIMYNCEVSGGQVYDNVCAANYLLTSL